MSVSQVQVGVRQARGLLNSLAEAALFGLSDADVLGLLEDVERLVCQGEELLVRVVGEVDARGAGREQRAVKSTKHVLMHRLRMTPSHAGQVERLAQALRDHQYAPTVAAFADGAIGMQHARKIVDAMGKLPDEAGAHTRDVVQKNLIEHAREYNPDQVAELGREALKRVDPDLADRVLAKQLEREERDALRERTLWFKNAGDGTVRFGGRLDAASAETVRTALDPLIKPPSQEQNSTQDKDTSPNQDAPRDNTAGDSATGKEAVADRRAYGQRQADALVELARRVMQAGRLPKHGGEPTQVVVTIRYEDLVRGLNAAYLPTGQPISASQARFMACDARIIPAVLDSASVPLDMGRGKRCFEGKLRKGLDLRDGGCRFPGCDIPAAWCDAHHIRPWWDFGPTELDNGVLLCRHHHRTIHQGEWTVRLGRDRRPEFVPPPWVDPLQQPLRNPLHNLPHAA